mmetsp:Transcript_43688/g.135957  ORF Transcript_43688/g.135957 Transcript_43688/m.135957 type:complete len:241 (-) Transcript_43688:234-956(-)
MVVCPLALLPRLLRGPDEVALLDDRHRAEALRLLPQRDHEARVGLDDLAHHVLAQVPLPGHQPWAKRLEQLLILDANLGMRVYQVSKEPHFYLVHGVYNALGRQSEEHFVLGLRVDCRLIAGMEVASSSSNSPEQVHERLVRQLVHAAALVSNKFFHDLRHKLLVLSDDVCLGEGPQHFGCGIRAPLGGLQAGEHARRRSQRGLGIAARIFRKAHEVPNGAGKCVKCKTGWWAPQQLLDA